MTKNNSKQHGSTAADYGRKYFYSKIEKEFFVYEAQQWGQREKLYCICRDRNKAITICDRLNKQAAKWEEIIKVTRILATQDPDRDKQSSAAYNKELTTQSFNICAHNFNRHPGTDNWALLERAMELRQDLYFNRS